MRNLTKLAGLAAVMGLAASPAFALPSQAPDNQGTAHAPAGAPYDGTSNPGTEHRSSNANPPGPNASAQSKAKAYGKKCQGQSKKRSDAAPGTKGTPFSQCVTAMARLATGQSQSPRTACKELSKKRSDAAPGTKGTPFSQCVVAGAKLLRERSSQS
jgi:hypothetical protein